MNSSLYNSMAAVGEEADLARRFMDLFSYDFDFGNDSRPGDHFRLLVEKVYLKGEFYHYGRVLAAEYRSGDTVLQTFFAEGTGSEGDEGGYYDEQGRSLKRLFIKAPVKGARMTSGFTMKRFHPVYKRYRPHLGVDYAAPTGTPIMAISDGEITFRGNKGGNGNLVIVKHENGYESLYAHMSRFNKRYKVGDRVKQKDIIGYVGTTGASTGPHLHLGVRKSGTYVDPLSIDSSRGEPLRGRELRAFQQERERLQGMIAGTIELPPQQDLTSAPVTAEGEGLGRIID
jgi:murein DD-endopeptidase MepM/ murein hydrolase activator NlpD